MDIKGFFYLALIVIFGCVPFILIIIGFWNDSVTVPPVPVFLVSKELIHNIIIQNTVKLTYKPLPKDS